MKADYGPGALTKKTILSETQFHSSKKYQQTIPCLIVGKLLSFFKQNYIFLSQEEKSDNARTSVDKQQVKKQQHMTSKIYQAI